jgi:hypothetical protein
VVGTRTKKPFREVPLEICRERGNQWANDVQVRLEGALSDLHAADARYHMDCKAKLTSPKSVTYAPNPNSDAYTEDGALDSVFHQMAADRECIWNSVQIFSVYKSHGSANQSSWYVTKVKEHFGEDLLILKSLGLSNIVLFRSKASTFLTLGEDENNDLENALSIVAKNIKADVEGLDISKNNYPSQVSLEVALDISSETVLKLLSKLSAKLDRSLPAILITSITTSILTNHPTDLQLHVALVVLMRESKELINFLHSFNVICSYNEILRFRKSAARESTHNSSLKAISINNSGMVQVIVDNFDADISSQNGKMSTHSLAVLVMQPCHENVCKNHTGRFHRIKKDEMTQSIDFDYKTERDQNK